jgi:hypothetical protein
MLQGIITVILFSLIVTSFSLVQHYPPFSFSHVNTYVQASNRSGLFSNKTLDYLLKQAFIVLDSDQGINSSPLSHNAESKIIAAANQIKQYAKLQNLSSPDIYMYSQIDYARTLYAAGEWFEKNPQFLLHNTDGTLAHEPQGHIYDHTQKRVQVQWATTIANPVLKSDGALDGVFIDGYRSSVSGYGFLGNVSNSTAFQWMIGALNASSMLRDLLPVKDYNIFNNPGQWASSSADAIMIELFFPDDNGIQSLINDVKNNPIVQVHSAVNFAPGLNSTHQLWAFEVTLAGFLAGMGEYTYFGGGVEWGNVTNWMQKHVDYSKHLGKPKAPAIRTDEGKGRIVYTREFESGTTLWHQTSPLASCIRWSDNTTSGTAC